MDMAAIRLSLGLNQAQMGKLFSVAWKAIWMWEKVNVPPKNNRLYFDMYRCLETSAIAAGPHAYALGDSLVERLERLPAIDVVVWLHAVSKMTPEALQAQLQLVKAKERLREPGTAKKGGARKLPGGHAPPPPPVRHGQPSRA